MLQTCLYTLIEPTQSLVLERLNGLLAGIVWVASGGSERRDQVMAIGAILIDQLPRVDLANGSLNDDLNAFPALS